VSHQSQYVRKPITLKLSLASTLFLHDREDTSSILNTNPDNSLVLTETRKQIESAWSQAETGHFMLKRDLMGWIDVYRSTSHIFVKPGNLDEWVNRHTECCAMLQQIRDARREGVRIPGLDHGRDLTAHREHDEMMSESLVSWAEILVDLSKSANAKIIPHSTFVGACPTQVCLHLKTWHLAYTTNGSHVDYVERRLQTVYPDHFE
jgi:hypothetical protein